jgi:hypothetical protein
MVIKTLPIVVDNVFRLYQVGMCTETWFQFLSSREEEVSMMTMWMMLMMVVVVDPRVKQSPGPFHYNQSGMVPGTLVSDSKLTYQEGR